MIIGVMVFEILPFSDTTNTTLSAGATVLESIPIGDTISTALSTSTTLFEIIPLFDSATAEIPIFSIVIYEIIPIPSDEIVLEAPSILFLLFLDREMWGYLGPTALVIIGYFVAKKDRILGIFWFVMECLVIGYYLALVSAIPDYWWHIYILLFGGLFTCVYPLLDR